MTPEQVTMVKDTWTQVAPISEQAAELFYGRLFELNPDYQSLFKGDMKSQGKMLMSMLNKGLGDAFTDEVKEAWTETYTTLATVMIEASKEVAA